MIKSLKKYMVHQLTCRVNGKRYIGITSDFHKRWCDHQNADSVIGRALRKHGIDNFRIAILYGRLPLFTAQMLEQRLIDKQNTLVSLGYNVASGGHGGDTTVGMTDEEKNRISEEKI